MLDRWHSVLTVECNVWVLTRHNGTHLVGQGTSQPAKPSPNPDDAELIVCRLMGLPVAARIKPGSVVTPLALRCSAFLFFFKCDLYLTRQVS
jgi:hypothetical protein